MPSFEEIQKARILNSFNTDEGLSELTKAEILDIEKGGKRAMIGEKRTFAGREYIKTADGWKFHGKGTGSKAQEHVAGALSHHVDSDAAIRDHAKEIAEDAGMKVEEFEKLNSETKKELWGKYKKNNPESSHIGEKKEQSIDFVKDQVYTDRNGVEWRFIGKKTTGTLVFAHKPEGHTQSLSKDDAQEFFTPRKSSKPTHKNATDHFVEDNGKHYIDTLDPDTGEKKFKPGDKVKYIDDNGKHHKGTLSDREHPDGDMFEVDREGGNSDSSIETEEIDPKEITNKQYSSESEKNMGEESIKKLKKLQEKK